MIFDMKWLRGLTFVLFADSINNANCYKDRVKRLGSEGRACFHNSGDDNHPWGGDVGMTSRVLFSLNRDTLVHTGEGILLDLLSTFEIIVPGEECEAVREVCLQASPERVALVARALLVNPSEDDLAYIGHMFRCYKGLVIIDGEGKLVRDEVAA